MTESEDLEKQVENLRAQAKEFRAQVAEDRKLIEEAAQVLAEIDRGPGLPHDSHADVLAALRIRLEGKPRSSLEELLSATGDIKGKKDLREVLGSADEGSSTGWPEVSDKKKEWPGL
jgi:hypothetical protein